MKLTLKFPTRSRPNKFKNTFLKYYHYLSGNNDFEFIISMDNDDESMNNESIKSFLKSFKNVKYYYLNNKSKVEAINANIEEITGDVILLCSDDMIPVQPSYDLIINDEFKKSFPDYDGVLHFNDGRIGDRLNTLVIMGYKYMQRFGYIYNPLYTSVYCDNEFTDVSRLLNKTVYKPEIIIKHYWVDYVGNDQLMQRNENPEYYKKDGEIYMDRKKINFNLGVNK